MLRLMILEGELVRIRSNVFPCLCVGVMIICVRFCYILRCTKRELYSQADWFNGSLATTNMVTEIVSSQSKDSIF